jgi:3-oxoacyl-[acyl-carrier-protein] synthase II
MELTALENVFGERRFPVFSIKGALGHTLGAAGVIEAALCAEALRQRTAPGTAGCEQPEPRAAGRVSDREQPFGGQNILTTNSGFGGVNAALIFTSDE